MKLPKEFYDDWVRVAGEESAHFYSWADRLTELGSHYGAMAGHDGLWDAAEATSYDLMTRLAIVNLVHEARGLDTVQLTRKKFENVSDEKSLQTLQKNSTEEIFHVGCGVKWFKYLCGLSQIDPIEKFAEIVKGHYRGYLTPPFNKEFRDRAGLTEEWYLKLALR